MIDSRIPWFKSHKFPGVNLHICPNNGRFIVEFFVRESVSFSQFPPVFLRSHAKN